MTAFERFKATTTVLQYQILNSPWRRLFERKQKQPLVFTHSKECERSEEGAPFSAISLAASFIFLHGSRVKLLVLIRMCAGRERRARIWRSRRNLSQRKDIKCGTKGKTFHCIGGSIFKNVFVLHLRANAHGKEEGKKVIAKMVYVGGQLYAD